MLCAKFENVWATELGDLQYQNFGKFEVKMSYIGTGLIVGLRPAKERRPHKVTPSLIGLAQTQNQPWRHILRDRNFQNAI